MAKAEKLTMQQLPCIPDVQPHSVLVLGKDLTGAVSSTDYLYSPWADSIGGPVERCAGGSSRASWPRSWWQAS